MEIQEKDVEQKIQEQTQKLLNFLPSEIKSITEEKLNTIMSCVSLETQLFIPDVVLDFFKLVYDLPASPPQAKWFGVHHQETFGLFIHSLEVCENALILHQKKKRMPATEEGKQLSAIYFTIRGAIEYIIFLCALFHDIGKIFTYQVRDKNDRRRIFLPFRETLYEFKQNRETEIIILTAFPHKIFNPFALIYLTKSDIDFIFQPKKTQGYSLEALEYLIDAITQAGQTEQGRYIISLISEADGMSAVFERQDTYGDRDKIQNYLVSSFSDYYYTKSCFIGEEYTAFLFPKVFKDIIQRIFRQEMTKDSAIPDNLFHKLITLLGDVLYTKDGKIVWEIETAKGQHFKAVLIKNSFLEPAVSQAVSQVEVSLQWKILEQTQPELKPQLEETPQKQTPPELQPELKDRFQSIYEFFKSLPIVEFASKEELYTRRSIIVNKLKEKFTDITEEEIEEVFEAYNNDNRNL